MARSSTETRDAKPSKGRELDETYTRTWLLACWNESYFAKRNRMALNRDNYAMYQLEHDFAQKKEGQSREVLSKVRDAVESTKSFFQQALSDLDDWYRITSSDGSDGTGMPITPNEMQTVMNYMLRRCQYFSHVGHMVQSGLLGSLAISEVGGELVYKPKFVLHKEGRAKTYKKTVAVEDDKVWELRYNVIRQEDYYPDPNEGCMYKMREYMIDMHQLRALAEGPDAIYDKDAVDKVGPWGQDDLQEFKRARETGQNQYIPLIRPRVKITEYWGTIVDNETGVVLAENCVATLANRLHVIRKPTSNPLWHQRDPIVAAALIEVAHSPWGIALMDAGTKHNRALTELFNLMLDSAMKAIWGVNQIRTYGLDDPTQITDGIRWGMNLKVNSEITPTTKVIEPCITGDIPPAVVNMFNLLNQEVLTSMKTNDLRMGGESMRQVKATEVVASENSITNEMQGMAKNFEEKCIQPELELGCWTICQNWDLIDKEVFTSLFGKERGEELRHLDPQDVFVATVQGMRFEVFGISLALRRQADFRKYTTLLQVIGQSQVLIEAFLQKYDFSKLLGEILTAVDINKSKLAADTADGGQKPKPAPQMPQQPGQPPAPGGAMPAQQAPMAANQPSGSPLAAAFGGFGGQMSHPSAQAIR